MSKSAYSVFLVVLAMWLVRIVDAIIPADLNTWGLIPRTLTGLIGIPLSPFLHGGFGHLISNTIPLVILLMLTISSRHRPWPVIIAITLGGGSLLWIVGRNASHVGASGLVFGLIAYLITVGFREKQMVSLGIAVLVGFLFGGTLLSGVVPVFTSPVSWEGHLCGAVAGLVVGYVTTEKTRSFF
ncbi:Rhomboid family protein [Rubripirellula amarantea]|uniref:Rhomboid family protein n=1 Tax=Rubripirellula amarantea TaxID=2527999 RepID=A0A5C5WJ82_9BACT|nr:rhomboid family intramembrane serine protease [Rubripirellula amarantea]TWT50175.1 Rhomboid family protein [Rubripirellula amarantea]